MTKTITYPERRRYIWEEKERLPYHWALDYITKQLRQRGDAGRKASYLAVLAALERVQHEHDPQYIKTVKLKQLLIAAAQEHGWYARDMEQMGKLQKAKPESVPDGMRWCRKCEAIKPEDDFKATPSAAQARAYGWREDTTQKTLHHLCAACRKARQQRQARALAKKNHAKKQFDPIVLRDNPALAKRLDAYHKVKKTLKIHIDRTRSAFTNVRKVIHLPEGDVYECQFGTDELRQFYESKKVLLKAAESRLEELFAEGGDIPATWGMLLTKVEQTELANLHSEAVMSVPARRAPALWSV